MDGREVERQMCADAVADDSVVPLEREVISSRPIDIFLRHDYVSRSFSSAERIECYLFNFHFLSTKFSPDALLKITGAGIDLFTQESESEKYTCRLSISKDYHYQSEGELSISLDLGAVNVYTLSFSVVPGYIVSLRASAVILIARMQGGDRTPFEYIRAATKHFQDVSPQGVLFAVLQGLAKALGIEYIVAVSARDLVGFLHANLRKFEQTYNEFFLSLGARGPIGGFFYFGPNGMRKFLSTLPTNHRSRAKAKRKFKLEISRASEERAVRSLLSAEDDTDRTPKTDVKIGRPVSALKRLLWAGDSRWSPENLAPLVAKLDPAQTEVVLLAPHLFSQAGRRVGAKLVATGAEGFLAYGPYMTLRAGRYSVRFALETNAPTVFGVDVVADNRTLVRGDFNPDSPITGADLVLESSTDYYDVEFRVFVSSGASIQFSGVLIKRLDPQRP